MNVQHTPFHAFLDAQRPTLAARIAGLLPDRQSATPDQISQTLAGWLQALDAPEQAVRLLDDALQAQGASPGRLVETTDIISAYRSVLLDAAIDAIAQGVGGAADGARALSHLLDLMTGRAAEAAVASSQAQTERLERIVGATPLSIIEFDPQGIIQLWNAGAERIFGWSRDEAIGRNVIELLVPSIALEHVQGILDALLSGKVANSRNENITKDGRLITCQWYNAVLYDSSGTIVGVLAQTEDITEQVQMQSSLLAAQEATLRELGTPLIPVTEDLVIMPLIGAIDSRRAQQVIETLLQGVGAHRANAVILDITGVPVVDTQVAGALLQAAQAVKLLGARVILTGIRPEIAQTLVSLGLDLSGVITRGTLQSGIAYVTGREQRGRAMAL